MKTRLSDRAFPLVLSHYLLAATIAGLVVSPVHAEQWTVEKTQRQIKQLALVSDRNAFAAGYIMLLAHHHLAPIISKGGVRTVGGGAAFELTDAGALTLLDRGGHRIAIKGDIAIYTVTDQGVWKKGGLSADEKPLKLLIKTRTTLFLIDLQSELIGVIDLPEHRN